MIHNKEGNGMWMCAFGECAPRPVTFPNQKQLDKHKMCYANKKCGDERVEELEFPCPELHPRLNGPRLPQAKANQGG